MAERKLTDAEISILEATVDFVARWAWRTDPPHASRNLSDAERLSVIKYHPIIKRAGLPHMQLAEAEAARAEGKGA